MDKSGGCGGGELLKLVGGHPTVGDTVVQLE
jgi:hypothetical protein